MLGRKGLSGGCGAVLRSFGVAGTGPWYHVCSKGAEKKMPVGLGATVIWLPTYPSLPQGIV